jgi:formylglycine-generating enzyme required for sulfatase activity
MGYNPSLNKNCDYCPVENVSWEEVMKFISKLNAISGRRFRLPTEAEWEYVAKLGGKDEIETAGGPEEFVKKTAWHFQNANNQTHQIGTKAPNVGGIFDMMGNVSEWCSDWYGTSFYKEAVAGKNPKGPSAGKEKIYRGGNFKDASGDRFRPSLRKKRNPVDKSGDLGFRLVLDID